MATESTKTLVDGLSVVTVVGTIGELFASDGGVVYINMDSNKDLRDKDSTENVGQGSPR